MCPIAAVVYGDESLLCSHKIPSCIKLPSVLMLCLCVMWFDTLFNTTRDQCEQRLNMNCLHMNLSSLQVEFEFLEYGYLKLKANTWNWMWQLLEFTNLPTITVKFIFKCLSFRAELWVPEHLDETFVPWVTGRQLPPPKLLTVVWHSLLSQLQALWHCAFLIHSQWTSLLLTQWKGCKLHFTAANPVTNRTLFWVHVIPCLHLAGARFFFWRTVKQVKQQSGLLTCTT